MIFEDIAEFAARLPRGQSVLGLDLGTKTIGVAASDGLLSSANPVETIKRRKFGLDAARLMEIAGAREAGGIILGPKFAGTDRDADHVLGRATVDRCGRKSTD